MIADAFEPRREPLPGAADQGMLARAAKEKAWGAESYLLLAVGSHLLLSCLGFSSASYLKVHVKTHHGVPLPQVSRHQEIGDLWVVLGRSKGDPSLAFRP